MQIYKRKLNSMTELNCPTVTWTFVRWKDRRINCSGNFTVIDWLQRE